MNVPWRTALRIVCCCALVLGVMSLLIESRSTGEAIETLRLHLLPGPIPMVALGLSLLAIAGFALLYFSDHKGKPRHP